MKLLLLLLCVIANAQTYQNFSGTTNLNNLFCRNIGKWPANINDKFSGSADISISIEHFDSSETKKMAMYIASGNPCVYNGIIKYLDTSGRNVFPREPDVIDFYGNKTIHTNYDFTNMNQVYQISGKYNALCVLVCTFDASNVFVEYKVNYTVNISNFVPQEYEFTDHILAEQQCLNIGNRISQTGIQMELNLQTDLPVNIILGNGIEDCGVTYSTKYFTFYESESPNILTSQFSVRNANSGIYNILISNFASYYCYFICRTSRRLGTRLNYTINLISALDDGLVTFDNVDDVVAKSLNTVNKNITEEIVDIKLFAAESRISSRIAKIEDSQESNKNLSNDTILMISIICVGGLSLVNLVFLTYLWKSKK